MSKAPIRQSARPDRGDDDPPGPADPDGSRSLRLPREVRPIIEAVKARGRRGAGALRPRIRQGRGAGQDAMRATRSRVRRGLREVEPEVRRPSTIAIDNIRRFHEAQKPEEMWLKEIRPGAFAGDRVRPDRLRRLLCPARQGLLSQCRHDDDGSRGRRGRAARSPSSPRPARTAGSMRRRWSRRGSAASRRSTNAAAPRPSPPWPMARDGAALRSRSSGPAAPGSWRPSACSPTSSIPAFRPARRMHHPRR